MPVDLRHVSRALISVSDKTGLVEFARVLATHGVELVSTGGTRKALAEAGLAVRDVADLTQFPEMMDGRLKTLHPKVHGGLLAIRENPEHEAAMLAHDIRPIDLLVVNLYPFEATLAKGAPFEECVENIDIGGPAMIRAASKNHDDVAVVVDPDDYADCSSRNSRRRMAQRGSRRVDGSRRRRSRAPPPMTRRSPTGSRSRSAKPRRRCAPSADNSPSRCATAKTRINPRASISPARSGRASQRRAKFRASSSRTTTSMIPMQPSNASRNSIRRGPRPSSSSNTPILAASPKARTLVEAYAKALRCDPVSAFGGIVALNRKLDADAAREIVKIFTEVIIAPDADEESISIIGAKKNLRLLLTGGVPDARAAGLTYRSVSGGFLAQSRDSAVVDEMNLQVVTKRQPTAEELADLKFAFRVVKHVKSNAIVYAKGAATVGIGAGQMSRVDSSRTAAHKAQEAARVAGLTTSLAKGAVVASDAFFPFADGLLAAAEAGVTAVIQPGGSMNDKDVIAAADAQGLAMVFTGVRHFRH